MSETVDNDMRERVREFGERNKGIAQLKFIYEDPEGFKLETVADQGLINQTFCVHSADGEHSAILKYGLDHLAPEALQHVQIPLVRQEIELNSLKVIDAAVPGAAPKPYCHDSKLQIVAMEYLDGMWMGGTYIRQQGIDVELAGKMGHMLGLMHARTHKDIIPDWQWQQIKAKFKTRELKDIYKAITFQSAFDENDPLCVPPENSEELLKKYLQDFKDKGTKEKCIAVYETEHCFVHGDSHTNSYMTNGKDLKFIDLEFGGPGCPMFDLALLVTFYVMFGCEVACSSASPSSGNTWHKIEEAVRKIVSTYLAAYGSHVHVLGEEKSLVSDMCLMFGNQFYRLPIFPPLDQMVILDEKSKLKFMKKGYKLLVKHDSLQTIEDVFQILFSEDIDHE